MTPRGFNRAVAAVLSAPVVMFGIAELATGTADARPREFNCIRIGQTIDDAYELANAAEAQGDYDGAVEWWGVYLSAQENYDRYCLSN